MIARDTQAAYIPAPEFTPAELQALHRYCLKYRDMVRGGGTPTADQSNCFMAFQRATYAYGVAYGHQ